MYDITSGLDGHKSGTDVVQEYITRFADDICADPPELGLSKKQWSGVKTTEPIAGSIFSFELIIAGIQLQEAASELNEDLKSCFMHTAETLIDTGYSRI